MTPRRFPPPWSVLLCAFCSRLYLNYVVDSIFGYVDLDLIEYTSLSGRGVLYLVEVANNTTEHMPKDFIPVRGGAHWRFLFSILGTYQTLALLSATAPGKNSPK